MEKCNSFLQLRFNWHFWFQTCLDLLALSICICIRIYILGYWKFLSGVFGLYFKRINCSWSLTKFLLLNHFLFNLNWLFLEGRQLFKTYLNFAVFFIVVAIIIRKFTANNCFFDKGFGSFSWSLGISISWLLFFVFLLLKLVREWVANGFSQKSCIIKVAIL